MRQIRSRSLLFTMCSILKADTGNNIVGNEHHSGTPSFALEGQLADQTVVSLFRVHKVPEPVLDITGHPDFISYSVGCSWVTIKRRKV